MLAFLVPGDSGQYLVRVRFTEKGRKEKKRKERKKGKKRKKEEKERLTIIGLDGICKKKNCGRVSFSEILRFFSSTHFPEFSGIP